MKTNGFSLPVRIIHMIGFEVIAVIIFAPIAAFVLNKGIMEVGALGLIISLTAMLWNFVYNYLFDTVETSLKMDRFNRSILTRIVHALFLSWGY